MAKNSSNRRIFTLNCKGKILCIDKPIVMGIVNTTPDSFYKESRVQESTSILARIEEMLGEGATIVDIGGQSTRPSSTRIEASEELDRVMPVIETAVKEFPDAIISIDTYYSSVAKEAVTAGARLVNDVSGGLFDPEMLRVVGRLGVPYVCMHTKGDRETMHITPSYENLAAEVFDYFIEKTDICHKEGISDIIIDPGFGFAKNIQHNFQLLKHLSLLKMINKPIMLGLSRKSTIYKTLRSDPENALNGTTVLNTIGLLNGADILRVHDVKEAVEAITLVQEVLNAGIN